MVPYPRFTGEEPCASVGVDVMYASQNDGMQLKYAQLRTNFNSDSDVLVKTTVSVAEVVCGSCPMLTQCREYAIAHEEYGIWGGTTPEDRKRIRRERRQAFVAIDYDPMLEAWIDELTKKEIEYVQGYCDDPGWWGGDSRESA